MVKMVAGLLVVEGKIPEAGVVIDGELQQRQEAPARTAGAALLLRKPVRVARVTSSPRLIPAASTAGVGVAVCQQPAAVGPDPAAGMKQFLGSSILQGNKVIRIRNFWQNISLAYSPINLWTGKLVVSALVVIAHHTQPGTVTNSSTHPSHASGVLSSMTAPSVPFVVPTTRQKTKCPPVF